MRSNLIRKKRQKSGFSQTRLACMVGLAQSKLSDIELGKVECWPKARRLIAEALRCSEEDVFPRRDVDGGRR
jgi:transcriptional regulator with XRE-family HTH domain